MSKQSLGRFFLHLLLFLLVEIIFVVIIFREFPPFDLLTLTGILHTSYWIVVVIAGLVRNNIKILWQRFLITYLPIVYHVVIHVYMGVISIEDMHSHGVHNENELLWIVVGTVVAGVIIGSGEYLLHRTERLEEHHRLHHADEDCEEDI